MKFWHISLIASVFIGLGLYYYTHPLTAKIRIHNTVITVDVAATQEQKQKGLGKRPSMPEFSGMLFPYDHTEQFEFWMSGMQFPLDFVWIDGKTVVDISENIPHPKPGETPEIVKPRVPVDKVLELNAGSIKRFGIAIDDIVTFLDR